MSNTAQEQQQTFAKALLSQKAEADYHENVQFGGAAKQYVRMYGWLAYIKDFTKRRSEAGVTTPFKYFTLPGSNMTDIGVLWNAGLIKPIEGKVNIAICDKVHANWVASRIKELEVELLASDKRVLHEALRNEN